jgi:predicted nucleotidyltransferase
LRIAGIICEYNPLHLGHKKQMDFLRAQGYGIVCAMSGNFVQRGHPAIFNKMRRAEAAVRCGADLVVELPIPYALSSAEGFAAGGVDILSRLCDTLCFGAEDANSEKLMETASALPSTEFSEKLRPQLDAGLSFPAARAKALTEMGMDAAILDTPNNILAVEYCKAILAQGCAMNILPIYRGGSYHDEEADAENPSATSLRNLLEKGEKWSSFVPEAAISCFENAPIHSLKNGEKSILYRLRTMTDAEFEALPYGSEGLWRKLMHASREWNTLDEIIAATKSKRYTRTRIDRMILCAFLGLQERDFKFPVPYCRVLAFNDTGRAILSKVREDGFFVNIGTDTRNPYQALERRATALYGLFAEQPERPDAEAHYRVYYQAR